MFGTMAHASTLLFTRASPAVSIGPKSILTTIVHSFYDAFNNMLKPFGLSIPTVALGTLALVTLLLGWAIINGLRNRKSFTLEDEPDAVS